MLDDDLLMDEIRKLAGIAREMQPRLISCSDEAKNLNIRFPHRTQGEIAEKIKAHFQGEGLFSNE